MKPPYVYNYSPVTGEYLAPPTIARKSPEDEDDVYLLPGHATFDKPPQLASDEVAIFKDGGWAAVIDQRGEWFNAQGHQVVVYQIDADVQGLTRTPPPGAFFELVDGAWVINLPAIKNVAVAHVRELRRAVFFALGGMQSEALANEDTATAKAIATIQPLLRDLPDIDLSACQSQKDIDAAFTAAWRTIAALAPVNVVSAFNEVLA